MSREMAERWTKSPIFYGHFPKDIDQVSADMTGESRRPGWLSRAATEGWPDSKPRSRSWLRLPTRRVLALQRWRSAVGQAFDGKAGV